MVFGDGGFGGREGAGEQVDFALRKMEKNVQRVISSGGYEQLPACLNQKKKAGFRCAAKAFDSSFKTGHYDV